MGKLVVTEFVSVDGVFEDPGGSDRLGDHRREQGAAAPEGDERLLGRKHRFGYASVKVDAGGAMPEYDGIRAWDLERGTTQEQVAGHCEALLASRPGLAARGGA